MEIEEVLSILVKDEFIEREKVIDVIKNLRAEGQPDEALDVFQVSLDYTIYGKELSCKIGYPVENGYFEYPNESYYIDERRDILKSIVKNSAVSIISAHFGHLLVNLGEKHNNFRSKAIEGYHELIDLVKSKMKAEQDPKARRSQIGYLYSYISNLGYLLLKREEKYTALVLELIKKEDLDHLPMWLISLAISDAKNFKQTDLNGLDEIIYDYGVAQDKGWSRIYQFEVGLTYDKRCAKKTKDWNYLIALEYEYMVENRSDLASIGFANTASRLYEQSDYLEDAKRMAEKYRELADSREFQTFINSIDITEQVHANLPLIEHRVKESFVEILDNLRVSNQIIPSKDQMLHDARVLMDNNFIIQIGGAVSIYDSNGNTAQSFHTLEQKIDFFMHEATYEYLRKNYHVWLGHLFDYLNEEEHWHADNVIDYFENHLWYGDLSIKQIGSGETIEYRFIDLISPGIRSYFNEIEKFKADRTYICNFQLALDSLTIRIEGILRNIAERNGIQTHYTREDENGTFISKEKDINMLLAISETDLIALLGEDFHLFLTHLLIHKNGSNLRNDIAHSFLLPQDYCNFKVINEVLVAIIRLGDKRFMTS
jgi:hypothetical protein